MSPLVTLYQTAYFQTNRDQNINKFSLRNGVDILPVNAARFSRYRKSEQNVTPQLKVIVEKCLVFSMDHPTICSARTCTNRIGPSDRCFPFPSGSRGITWQELLLGTVNRSTGTLIVCSSHFSEQQYVRASRFSSKPPPPSPINFFPAACPQKTASCTSASTPCPI